MDGCGAAAELQIIEDETFKKAQEIFKKADMMHLILVTNGRVINICFRH